ncbi:MAG: hypothetical protein CL993_02300 [Euryarchaeota archaeon]|nr:hypothetical protein [Euryarchaeota archaeon]|tara:strand:+ start:1150 stop:1869 length:720 start_codon:yes stop_codon:yes gene_type:complete
MEHLSRVPKDRIAVLIGKGGQTRKMIEDSCGGTLTIDSQTGDVSIVWDEEVDPIKKMKIPDVINAIGRGLAPRRAIQLIEDEMFLRIYDIREWVGRQPKQTKRMRGRLIGTNGRIRTLIEEFSNCEIAIYGSTVVVIGDRDGLELAAPAIEGILRGSEHGTVLFGLEKDRKRQRLKSKNLDTFQERGKLSTDSFESMVPGLSEARRKRRNEDSILPHSEKEKQEITNLVEDESILFEEE